MAQVHGAGKTGPVVVCFPECLTVSCTKHDSRAWFVQLLPRFTALTQVGRILELRSDCNRDALRLSRQPRVPSRLADINWFQRQERFLLLW